MDYKQILNATNLPTMSPTTSTTKRHTSDISSSGCTSFIVNPDDDSGFLIVGAADIVAEGVIGGVELDAVDEYAGNVGFIGGADAGIEGAGGFCGEGCKDK